MNERIKELIAQAEAYAYEKQPGWTDGPSSYALFREKFAELIVRECFECIDIMEKIAASNNCSIPVDYDKHTYLETLDTMRGLLGAHFGVK